MVAVLQFFSKYAVLIFLLLLIGLMFAIRGLIRAQREKREAVFALEIELAHRHIRQSTAIMSIVILLALSEFVIVVFLTPILPALSVLSRPTDQLGALPTKTIPPEILETLNATTPVSTPTLAVSGCIPGQIMLTYPTPGQEVKGKIILQGTANIPNFGFYKYEFTPLGANLWSTVQAGREPRISEDLGSWDTSEIVPGDYILRLVVTNNNGDVLPPCEVPVRIIAP